MARAAITDKLGHGGVLIFAGGKLLFEVVGSS